MIDDGMNKDTFQIWPGAGIKQRGVASGVIDITPLSLSVAKVMLNSSKLVDLQTYLYTRVHSYVGINTILTY